MPLLISSRSFYRHSDQVTLVKNADYSNYFGNPVEADDFDCQLDRFAADFRDKYSLWQPSSVHRKSRSVCVP